MLMLYHLSIEYIRLGSSMVPRLHGVGLLPSSRYILAEFLQFSRLFYAYFPLRVSATEGSDYPGYLLLVSTQFTIFLFYRRPLIITARAQKAGPNIEPGTKSASLIRYSGNQDQGAIRGAGNGRRFHLLLIRLGRLTKIVINSFNFLQQLYRSYRLKSLTLMRRAKLFKEVNDQTTELYDKVTRLETKIIDKINQLKKSKAKTNFICEHMTLDPNCPEFDPRVDYYDLFWKTFLLNEIKKTKVQSFSSECASLSKSIAGIERRFEKYSQLVSYRGSGAHFSPHSAQQKYSCKIRGCGKTYESLGALDLHHKLKHESSREEESQSSILARIGGGHRLGKFTRESDESAQRQD